MHFGEYELSPSLIGLSLLPSPHPEAFQRLSVRSSIPCYRDFNLDKGRSLGFASATADYAPYSDSLSLRLRASLRLTLPTTALVGSLCKRHAVDIIKMLRPLVGVRFRNFSLSDRRCFSPFPHGTGSLSVSYEYFSLGGWARRIQTGFHVSRPTQDTTMADSIVEYETVTLYGRSFQNVPLIEPSPMSWSYNPVKAETSTVWALPRSLATTGGIIVIFFS